MKQDDICFNYIKFKSNIGKDVFLNISRDYFNTKKEMQENSNVTLKKFFFKKLQVNFRLIHWWSIKIYCFEKSIILVKILTMFFELNKDIFWIVYEIPPSSLSVSSLSSDKIQVRTDAR